MYEIVVLNPRSGKKSARKRKRAAKRSPVMAKRRRKLSAKQIAAGFGGKKRRVNARRRPHAKRARNARRRRRNPSGKKRYVTGGYVRGKGRIRRLKLNPRRRHRRNNPRFSVSGITSQLMPAAYGAAGGIALDVALGYIPLPAMLKSGYPKHATRIVGAMGIGWAARKFLGSKGAAVGHGALIVAMYGLLKDVIVQFAPQVKGLGDYEEISIDNTADQIGAYMPGAQMGAYLPDGSSAPGMGAYLGGDFAQSFDVSDTAGANLGGMEY